MFFNFLFLPMSVSVKVNSREIWGIFAVRIPPRKSVAEKISSKKLFLKFEEIKFQRRTIILLADTNFLDFSRYFLKCKPCCRIVEACFSTSFIRLVQTDFLPTEAVFFWSAILLLLEIITAIKRQWYFFSSSGNVYFSEILHFG